MDSATSKGQSKKISERIRTQPFFPAEGEHSFYATLKERVKPLFVTHGENVRRNTLFKVITYPTLYLLAYVGLLICGRQLIWLYMFYITLGLLVTLNIFNIIHDAVHHALFEQERKNALASYLLDMMGGNSFVWKIRHVIYHHTFTNIPGWDIDIQQTGLVRFIPSSTYHWIHKIQWVYMPFLYLFYTLNLVLVRDFKDFFKRLSLVKNKTRIPTKEYVKLFAFKATYFSYILALPFFILQVQWFHIVIGFLVMHAVTSSLTLLILLPSHLDEHAHFPNPGNDLQMENSWAIHQLMVTNDFGTNSAILNFIMGGLNHHIAHHLFPNVNHNMIPLITEHIRKLAGEIRLPYNNYTLWGIMTSHFRLLKKNGHRPGYFEDVI